MNRESTPCSAFLVRTALRVQETVSLPASARDIVEVPLAVSLVTRHVRTTLSPANLSLASKAIEGPGFSTNLTLQSDHRGSILKFGH